MVLYVVMAGLDPAISCQRQMRGSSPRMTYYKSSSADARIKCGHDEIGSGHELFHQSIHHPRQIIGETCGDKIAVDDNRLVANLGPGIFEVDVDVPNGGGLAPLQQTGVDQHPWPMADAAHGLSRLVNGLQETMGILVGTKEIGVPAASRHDDGVVIGGLRRFQILIDLEPAGIFHEADGENMGLGDGWHADTIAWWKLSGPWGHDMDDRAMLAEPAV